MWPAAAGGAREHCTAGSCDLAALPGGAPAGSPDRHAPGAVNYRFFRWFGAPSHTTFDAFAPTSLVRRMSIAMARGSRPGGRRILPPFGLIPRVLQQVARQQVELTLIAPLWGAHWWPQLAQLCLEPPRLLPRAPDLFLALDGSALSPPRWRTAVFRLHGGLQSFPSPPMPLPMCKLSNPRQCRRSRWR
eukprot:SAG11_NODE_57_length_19200_cov_18.288417_7_plen_189_part_00